MSADTDTVHAMAHKMHIVIVGHVDHGKSTVVGRLLADTDSLPQGKLEAVKAECKRTAKPFEYAFLLDALKDEQEQGITIDTARCFFKSDTRGYIIIDAPGHVEFLKNMISGAARAQAALLVIDAKEGIQANSKRHGYLLSMLGIRQVAVCVNKMDLVDYDQAVFDRIETEYRAFLQAINLEPKLFVPLAAREGDNIMTRSEKLPWYTGPSVLEVLDGFTEAPSLEEAAFRMPVQGIYKFTEGNDDRRLVVGRVESGSLAVGDAVEFLPSKKRGVINSLEIFAAQTPTQVRAGESVAVTLTEQIFIKRGELMYKPDEGKPPVVGTELKVDLFWMGVRPLEKDHEYVLKIGTARVPAQLVSTDLVIDASTLHESAKDKVERHDVAKCTLGLGKPVAFDYVDALEGTSRFVLVDAYDIAGGGIIVRTDA